MYKEINTNELWYNYWWRDILETKEVNKETHFIIDVYEEWRWQLTAVMTNINPNIFR